MIDLDIERAKLRRAALLGTLYSVWPQPLGSGLLAESLAEDLRCSGDCLRRDLYYLNDRGLIALERGARGGADIATLRADGVDAAEQGPDFDPTRLRGLRMLRLRVLQALDWGRPQPLGTRLIARALAEDTDLDLSEPSLLRAIAYLVERGLAERIGASVAKITPDGIDYVSGDGDGVNGVARPLDW